MTQSFQISNLYFKESCRNYTKCSKWLEINQ